MIRIVSAVALIALLVVTVWWLHPVATVVLATAIAMLGAVELVGLTGSARSGRALWQAVLAGSACAFVAMGTWSDVPVLIITPAILLAAVMTLHRGVPDRTSVRRASDTALGYVGVPLGAIARTRVDYGPEAVSLLAVLVIASDSAQYFTGRALGRRKLAPSISPAKTIEGAIGGVVAAAAIGATLGVRWLPALTPMKGAALGLIVTIVGIIGDLFESALKRGAGVKDSSNLIPGHGGMLDRIDSWLLAGPVFFLFLKYLL